MEQERYTTYKHWVLNKSHSSDGNKGDKEKQPSPAHFHHHLHSSRNDDGIQCLPFFDPLHTMSVRMYCGRFVDQHGYENPCGKCDGKCGPEGGCQCKSCARLNAETDRRDDFLSTLSPNSKYPVQTSFNKSSHAVKKCYQFYCGRFVGKDNYFNHCQLCEGKCGPRTGCQCTDCHELEMKYAAVKRSSRESSRQSSRESSPKKLNRHLEVSKNKISSSHARIQHQSKSTVSTEYHPASKLKNNSVVDSSVIQDLQDKRPFPTSSIASTGPIVPFSPIYSVRSPFGSYSSDEDPTDILADLSIIDLSVERVNELRTEVAKLQSVQHCEDIEIRLEELLHVVRQRKRALIIHGRKEAQVLQKNNQIWTKPCVVCHRNQRNMVVVPCGHPCLCDECSLILTKTPTNNRKCPVCDHLIEHLQKIAL